MTAHPDAAVLDRLRQAVGPAGLLEGPADTEPFRTSFGATFRGEAALVLRPASTQEVAEVVRLCAEARIAIVPQAGNTGLSGGAQPDGSGTAVILSVDRMRKVRAVDVANDTLTVEAGVTLAEVQAEAERVDRLFPLTLASEGSCRIGGNLATNAGGTQVLRYGNMRELAFGLEVVLPDGRIWNGLSRLRKDNTGYALKDLFIGAEGTLGIITAAVLRLFPAPRARATALLGIADPETALSLFRRLRNAAGDSLTGFEIMPDFGLEIVLKHMPGSVRPLAERHAWYVLAELTSTRPNDDLSQLALDTFEAAFEAGEIEDAVVGSSEAQCDALWKLREDMSDAQKFEGGSIKHDVSVPVSKVPYFIAEANRLCEAHMPGIRICAFGHMGDGNIHYNLSQPEGMDKAAYLATWEEFNRIVHDLVASLGGSISAEHGIGILKREELPMYKDKVALDVMAAIKRAIDPRGLANPGKVLMD